MKHGNYSESTTEFAIPCRVSGTFCMLNCPGVDQSCNWLLMLKVHPASAKTDSFSRTISPICESTRSLSEGMKTRIHDKFNKRKCWCYKVKSVYTHIFVSHKRATQYKDVAGGSSHNNWYQVFSITKLYYWKSESKLLSQLWMCSAIKPRPRKVRDKSHSTGIAILP